VRKPVAQFDNRSEILTQDFLDRDKTLVRTMWERGRIKGALVTP
jgi:hypothetical protein